MEFLTTRFGSHPLIYSLSFQVDAIHECKRDEPARAFDLCSFPNRLPQLEHTIVYDTLNYRYPSPIDKPTFLSSIALPKPLYVGLQPSVAQCQI